MSDQVRGVREPVPWRRWLALLALVVIVVAAFVNLGRWQLDRLDQRRDSNATVTAHEQAPVRPYEEVFVKPIADEDQWQRVTVTGTFDASRQLVIRYRSNAGQTGWEVVAPLRASDGRTVLIDRGFKQRQPGTDFPAAEAAPPGGTVTVTGYVRRNEQGDDDATIPTDGSVRLINSAAIGRTLGVDLVDGYIAATSTTPGDPGGYTPIAPPPLDEGPHLSYALQWFTFSLIAIGGLYVFIRNDIRDRRKAAARAATRAVAAGHPPTERPAERADQPAERPAPQEDRWISG